MVGFSLERCSKVSVVPKFTLSQCFCWVVFLYVVNRLGGVALLCQQKKTNKCKT